MKTMFRMLAMAGMLGVASVGQASFIDATTSGSWIGTYGANGYILPDYVGGGGVWQGPINKSNDLTLLPGYVTDYSYPLAGADGPYAYKWGSGVPSGDPWFGYSAQDPRPGVSTRETCTAYYGGAEGFKVSLTLTANAPSFRMAVYAYDFGDNHNRVETIAAQWSGETTPFDSAVLNGYYGGKYAVFDVTPGGKTGLDIVITPGAGTFNGETMLQGIMFSPAPEPGTICLLLTGMIGFFAYAWRKRR